MRSMTHFTRLVMALAILCAGVGPAFGANRRPLVIISGQTQTLPAATGLQTSAATTANPSINLPPGTAPTSPADGDVWFTTAGMYIRVAGSTVGPLSAGGSPGGSSGQIQYNNSGAFGGFTASGDATVNTSTGVVTVAQAAKWTTGRTITLTGDTTGVSGSFDGSGNLSFATTGVQAAKWTTGRTLSITGDLAYTSPSLDGSGNVTAAGTLATVNSNVGTFGDATHVVQFTVNAKGLITAASNVAITAAGTVTHTGALTSGQLVLGNGTADIAVGDLSGDISTSGSGATTIGALKVATGMIQANAVTLAKLATQADQTILGNNTGGTAAPVALTAAQTRTLLGTVIGTNVQAWDADLDALAALSGTNTIYYRSAANTWSPVTIGAGVAFSGGSLSATGAAVPTTSLSPPQGRLTLVTGVPVMTSDQTAKSHVYYTPYVGAVVPVYSGSAWALTTLSADLDMALDTSNQLVESVYDLYVWNGGASIGAGPAWSSSATVTVTIATPAVVTWTAHGLAEGAPVIFTNSGGALPTGITAGTTYYVGRSPGANSFNISTSVANAGAGTFVATSGSQSGTHTGTNHTMTRGAGAGTTELQMLNGIWTNKNSITLTNGAGAGTSGIAANTATYVGSVYMTANGQTGMQFTAAAASGGSNAFLALFNAYNRVPMNAQSLESTASWNYASTTWRGLNGNVGNRITYLDGLAQIFVKAWMQTQVTIPISTALGIGVNLDNTTSVPPIVAQVNGLGSGATFIPYISVTAKFNPALGVHYLQQMESALAGTVSLSGQNGRQQQALIVDLTI